ncbi:unnamed protein product [Amoebophrya sp. A120]|nr:unnamed protein product [Amoebophrya sp. A120]|eukprot:GSA120T00007844001.1
MTEMGPSPSPGRGQAREQRDLLRPRNCSRNRKHCFAASKGMLVLPGRGSSFALAACVAFSFLMQHEVVARTKTKNSSSAASLIRAKARAHSKSASQKNRENQKEKNQNQQNKSQNPSPPPPPSHRHKVAKQYKFPHRFSRPKPLYKAAKRQAEVKQVQLLEDQREIPPEPPKRRRAEFFEKLRRQEEEWRKNVDKNGKHYYPKSKKLEMQQTLAKAIAEKKKSIPSTETIAKQLMSPSTAPKAAAAPKSPAAASELQTKVALAATPAVEDVGISMLSTGRKAISSASAAAMKLSTEAISSSGKSGLGSSAKTASTTSSLSSTTSSETAAASNMQNQKRQEQLRSRELSKSKTETGTSSSNSQTTAKSASSSSSVAEKATLKKAQAATSASAATGAKLHSLRAKTTTLTQQRQELQRLAQKKKAATSTAAEELQKSETSLASQQTSLRTTTSTETKQNIDREASKSTSLRRSLTTREQNGQQGLAYRGRTIASSTSNYKGTMNLRHQLAQAPTKTPATPATAATTPAASTTAATTAPAAAEKAKIPKPTMPYSVATEPDDTPKWLAHMAIQNAITENQKTHMVAQVQPLYTEPNLETGEIDPVYAIAVTPVTYTVESRMAQQKKMQEERAKAVRAMQAPCAACDEYTGATGSANEKTGNDDLLIPKVVPASDVIPLSELGVYKDTPPAVTPVPSIDLLTYLNKMENVQDGLNEKMDVHEKKMDVTRQQIRSTSTIIDRIRRMLTAPAPKPAKPVFKEDPEKYTTASCLASASAIWLPVAVDKGEEKAAQKTELSVYRPLETDEVCRCGSVKVGGLTGLTMEQATGDMEQVDHFGCFSDGKVLRWIPPWNLQPKVKKLMTERSTVADMLCSEVAPAMGFCAKEATIAGKKCDPIYGCRREDCCLPVSRFRYTKLTREKS